MHRLILSVALLLAACAPAPQVTGFKRPEVPIYSAAAFTAPRIEGTWQQAATFSAGKGPGCRAGGVRFAASGGGLVASGSLCLNGQVVPVSGPVTVTGPGRLSVAGMEEWWVIWVDTDYRTLAVATPSGRFGFVLDRGKIGRDRMTAAAEIFDFNGYGKSRLHPF